MCTLEDVSPGPGSTPQSPPYASLWGKMLSLSVTGLEKAIGPATSWSSLNGDVVIDHLAAADENGKLMLFYSYSGSDWKAVNVSEAAGVTVAITRPESWVFTDTADLILERLAAPAPNGDLQLFTWHAGSDWEATNLSTTMGRQITGPVTSWSVPAGSTLVEHIGARATNNDFLVFYRYATGNWGLVNVTSLTGQQVGGPGVSWIYNLGSEYGEYVAAPAPNGDLILFTFEPSTDWTVKDLTSLTGQKVAGPATHWVAPTSLRTEYLAAPASNGDLVVFYTDPIEGGWHVRNLTNETGQKVAGPATNWLVQDSGGTWWTHLAAEGPDGHLYVFYTYTGGRWAIVDVTNLTGKTIAQQPTSWLTAHGSSYIENVAAPGWDGHMFAFSFEAATDWTVDDITIKANGRNVFAAAEAAGVWMSNDYGMTWVQSTRPQPGQGAEPTGSLDVPVILDVAVSPSNPKLVVAGTDDDNRSPSRTGIYRSTDGGSTWTLVHQFTCDGTVQPVTQVIFAPGQPGTLYAAGGCAVAVSGDSGATWTDVTLPGVDEGARVWHVAASTLQPGDVRRMFACGAGTMWYSPDSGQNWYTDNGAVTGLPSNFCTATTTGNGEGAQLLAVDPSNAKRVYLAAQSRANGPSYFHPVNSGPDGVHCNNPVVYDSDNDNVYDTGETLIWGKGPKAGAALKDDSKIMFVDSNGNNVLDSSEAVVYDLNGDGKYSTVPALANTNEPVLRGSAPALGTTLQDDAKIKHIDMGTSFGPRGCGEGSLWYGDLSSFDPSNPTALSGTWTQLPGPPVYWTGESGAAYVKTQATSTSYLVFFSDRDTLHVSVGKPTEGSWHRIDGWDPSQNKRQGEMYSVSQVHIDPHGLAISVDFDLTLKAVTDQSSPYNLNKELDTCVSGRLWMSNDGGVYRSDDCGQTWIPAQSGLSTLAADNIAGLARLGTEPSRPNPAPALYFGTGHNDDFYSLNGGKTYNSPVGACGDCNNWFVDPSQVNRIWRAPGRTGSGAMDLFVNPSGGYPYVGDASQLTAVDYPTPTGSLPFARIGDWGYRPIIQTLSNEAALTNGDYILLQEIRPTSGSAYRILLRAKNTANTSTPWSQEGPNLPSTVSLAQAAGGHTTPTYYVGDYSRLWRSHRNSQGTIDQWQQIVPGGGANVAQRYFVNPYDADEVYIADTDGIKVSTDGGTTWNIDASLDAALTAGGVFLHTCGWGYANCVLQDMAFDRQNPDTRFAAGLAGVFYSGDATNWFRLVDTRALPSRPSGLWYNPITDPNDRSLYIAFTGRGIMRCHPIPAQAPAPPPTPTVTPTGGVPPTATRTPTPTPTTPSGGYQLLFNPDFESGLLEPWIPSGVVDVVDERAHTGRHSVRLGSLPDSADEIAQVITLPRDAGLLALSYWWFIDTDDTQDLADTLQVFIQTSGMGVTLGRISNTDPRLQWRQSWFDLSAFRGQQVTLSFRSEQNKFLPTRFYLDDIRLDAFYPSRLYLPVILSAGR